MLANLGNAVDFGKLSLTEKYSLLSFVLEKPFDKGSSPFQDFALLVTLRNDIVHFKLVKAPLQDGASEPQFEFPIPKVVQQLAKMRLTSDLNAGWLNQIMTQKLARWACDTSSSIVRGLVAMLPEGTLKEFYSFSLKSSFKIIE